MSEIVRRALEEANKRADYSKPAFQKQRSEMDMFKIQQDLARIAKRVLILTLAFDLLQQDVCQHPMQALLYAFELEGPVSTEDFFKLLETWAALCNAGTLQTGPIGAQVHV